MQGPSRSITLRLSVVAIFLMTFVCAASMVFGLLSLAGHGPIAEAMPLTWRIRLAAATLGALTIFDLVAIRRNHFCPLTPRRQTPAVLIYRGTVPAAAAVWGFDTGLMVTTFRVAATSWGALVLALLGLASWWWSALAYAAAFTVPLSLMMLFQPVEEMDLLTPLRRRAQALSAVLLVASSALLVTTTGM